MNITGTHSGPGRGCDGLKKREPVAQEIHVQSDLVFYFVVFLSNGFSIILDRITQERREILLEEPRS